MTEARYFYTDPLAAAWMHKHFGMEFTDNAYIRNNDCKRDMGIETLYCESPPFCIHPDSLHLLEPQPGDLVTYRLGVVGCVGKPHDDGPIGVWWAGSEGQDPVTGKEQIIQRDAIAFHWPECEAA